MGIASKGGMFGTAAHFERQTIMALAVALPIALNGCSNNSWSDTTNQHRGNAELKMDYAVCQQAGDSAQSDAVTQASATCNDAKCQALIIAASPIARPSAIDNCLIARGWQKVAALPDPSLSDSNPTASIRERFKPVPNASTVFIFPIYSSEADKSWFGSTYRLLISGSVAGTFLDNQYIEAHLTRGSYQIEIQQFGWLGTYLHNTTASMSVNGNGDVYFVAVPTSSFNISLQAVGSDYAIAKMADRMKVTGK